MKIKLEFPYNNDYKAGYIINGKEKRKKFKKSIAFLKKDAIL